MSVLEVVPVGAIEADEGPQWLVEDLWSEEAVGIVSGQPKLGKTWLALFPRTDLAADAGVSAEGSGFPGFALAHNVRTREGVDQLLAEAAAGGGRIVKSGHDTDWGGYAGYFADPDGFLWEVAWNPDFPHV